MEDLINSISVEERQEKVRTLLRNLADRLEELTFSKPALLARLQIESPDQIETIHRQWESLGSLCRAYMDGLIPWDETQEDVPDRIRTIQGSKALDLKTGTWGPLQIREPGVTFEKTPMSAARDLYVLAASIAIEVPDEE